MTFNFRLISQNSSSKTQARRALYHNIYDEVVSETTTTASPDKVEALRGEAQLEVMDILCLRRRYC